MSNGLTFDLAINNSTVTATGGEYGIYAATTDTGETEIYEGTGKPAADGTWNETALKTQPATVSLTVAADPATVDLSSGSAATVDLSAELNFVLSSKTLPEDVTAEKWTVEGNKSSDTKINGSTLTVAAGETAASLTVKAEYSTYTNSTTVTVKPVSQTAPSTPETKYTVTILSFTNGKVETDTTSAAAGATVTLTAIPSDGYRLERLTVTDESGAEVTVNGSENTYTFTMPAGNVTVVAEFKASGSSDGDDTDAPVEPTPSPTPTPTPTPTPSGSGSGTGSGGNSSGTTTTTTTTNPDGSTTTTTTDRITGTVTETTKNTDGSTSTKETKTDGTVCCPD